VVQDKLNRTSFKGSG